LRRHLEDVRALHNDDLHDGFGAVALPDALARKIPGAPKEWTWQWVFPATSRYKEQDTKIERRHHLHETPVQRAVRTATLQSGLAKRVTCHSATPSPRTSWSAATTSARSRSSSATATWPRR
jgi:hypothetical protein